MTTERNPQALLPCPFCGGEASDAHIAGTASMFTAANHTAGCFLKDFQRNREGAITAWNTRAPDASAPERNPQGRWVYRPNDYDDWGIVRDTALDDFGFQRVICQANYVASPDELTQHRVNGTDPAEANARLIASAPELLAALKDMLDHYVALINSGDAGNWNPENEPQVIAARAAISKATAPVKAGA